jgi:hypothetical protein
MQRLGVGCHGRDGIPSPTKGEGKEERRYSLSPQGERVRERGVEQNPGVGRIVLPVGG